jgi:hypothetical protein
MKPSKRGRGGSDAVSATPGLCWEPTRLLTAAIGARTFATSN